ncbi:E1-like protein-activating enzyme G [Saprolegnia parasitica CBS 223.65]|uniref:Ubiquitin-like modifier-activating enzyme ATG7 n=1 Tax=Saprolegnia parasitica (strain CBS 223.65) TaxID=695850 RepID=A0A067CQ32_SAPPC|nr:E1-like protein-activating enzyme G [Saprolegnia parasitica CBS 223.65]KDO28631.1 E1-like protein-activating enzyme G [Saprolegnia parasitica CBS 223.65]|eukprot:XP_012200693.1 E1-like protein-activating enzyme G [Saprolegnia parasitica CBS 223.65]
MAAPVLQFQPFTSSPHVSFFQKLAELKLNTFQLSDARQDISGFFELSPHADVPPRFIVDDTAFGYEAALSPDRAKHEWRLPGVLINTNTLEAFKTIDKAALLDDARASVASSIAGDTEKMQCFVLVTFADLKTHTFWYRFAFPALVPPSPYRVPAWQQLTTAPLAHASFMQQLLDMRSATEVNGVTQSNFPMHFVLDTQAGTVLSLPSAPASPENLLFGIVDPSALPQHPGWPLRNYLAWIRHRYPSLTSATVLLYRDPLHHLTTVPASIVAKASFVATISWANDEVADTKKVVGWELNVQGKQGPRCMQLGSLMDPLQLAKTSVDLNLKLMRWRQLPSLDLDKLASTKCLLLGAGTLGCHVGRNLLSWGFRHMTFVDNGLVSHSNPVRQPLFEFHDVGKPKAATAAKALARIFPLVHAEGHTLSIPMAGHAMSSPAALADNEQAFHALRALIEAHDVIFLGTDSRESRWLPTVMAAASQKLVINAALGFDSYLVMRHGVPDAVDLGCYFCNDIVSPGDSLSDRTLDQMCTVTRPGGAAMAGATAVELLVCLLHQPLGVAAPVATEASAGALGVVPHQIRGFLHSFSQVLVQGPSFPKCTACSRPVRDAFTRDGFNLFASVCASKTYLQDLTGLSALLASADAMTFADDDVSDDDDDESLL